MASTTKWFAKWGEKTVTMAAVSEQWGSADRAVLGSHPGLTPPQPGREVWPATDFPLERMEVRPCCLLQFQRDHPQDAPHTYIH